MRAVFAIVYRNLVGTICVNQHVIEYKHNHELTKHRKRLKQMPEGYEYIATAVTRLRREK